MLKRRNIHRKHPFNIGGIIFLIAAVYFTSYILLADEVLPISIYSVWSYISHWATGFRLVAVGLLPVYVALMVFGMAMIGVYFGSALQRFITRFIRRK